MGQEFRCLKCGAQFAMRTSFCSACWASGSIVPLPHRSHADFDSVPGISNAKDVARAAWAQVRQNAFPDLILGASCLVEISGPSGSGKSTMASRLADSVSGPCLYVSAEEGLGAALASRLLRAGVKRSDFHICSRASVDQVIDLALSRKVISLVIDSIQECCWRADELRHVLAVIPTLDILVAVMQINKEGQPAGAYALQHEADVHAYCEKMRWRLLKSRYQPLDTAGGDVLPPAPVPLVPPSTTLEIC